MDVKMINPFIEAVAAVMPQLGFSSIERKGLAVKVNPIQSEGVLAIIGITGKYKGNVLYCLEMADAFQIASKMMMGMPVTEMNEMAQSAISELSNMLSANASIKFDGMGIDMNISPPTLLYGSRSSMHLPSNKIISVQMAIDQIPFEINIAIE